MKKYYLYFLRCEKDKLYIGITDNLKERFLRHKKGKGAKFTLQNKPHKIVYVEEFNTLKEVMQRERQLKKWSRKKKEDLINGKLKNKK